MVNLLWLTKKLVSINSVSGNELAIQKFIFNLLQQEGFKPRFQFVYKGRPNVVCTSGEGKQHLLLDCHVDTVPACAGWKANPLKVRVQGGRMIGLGAADQKAGVAIHLKQFIE
ncbi:M20 family metallopeptidase, partial [Candidatus Parvarchaeota archaeon]|nr:M20 family metallopeptidase [Candidatus Parvarchaeota archaeon]